MTRQRYKKSGKTCQYSAIICQYSAKMQFSGSRSPPEFRGSHLVTAAELFIEGCPIGKAAHLGDKGDGVVGI